MVALREAYEDRDSGIPTVFGAEDRLIAWEGGNHFFPVVDPAVRSSDLSSIARRATDESEAWGRQNIVGYLNTSGGWKQTVELDAFGNTINSSGTSPALRSSDLSCIARKATDESEARGHRYYNPLTGRFLNRDPIREAGGLNLYAHTRNDHVNLWDVRGLSPHDRFTAGDNSLWDQVMGIAGRLLSDAGLRHQRYHASNARYELWLQTMVPISEGSGTLQPRPTLRGPILRHSQQEPGGDWSGLRGGSQFLKSENLGGFLKSNIPWDQLQSQIPITTPEGVSIGILNVHVYDSNHSLHSLISPDGRIYAGIRIFLSVQTTNPEIPLENLKFRQYFSKFLPNGVFIVIPGGVLEGFPKDILANRVLDNLGIMDVSEFYPYQSIVGGALRFEDTPVTSRRLARMFLQGGHSHLTTMYELQLVLVQDPNATSGGEVIFALKWGYSVDQEMSVEIIPLSHKP